MKLCCCANLLVRVYFLISWYAFPFFSLRCVSRGGNGRSSSFAMTVLLNRVWCDHHRNCRARPGELRCQYSRVQFWSTTMPSSCPLICSKVGDGGRWYCGHVDALSPSCCRRRTSSKPCFDKALRLVHPLNPCASLKVSIDVGSEERYNGVSWYYRGEQSRSIFWAHILKMGVSFFLSFLLLLFFVCVS